MNPFSYEEYRCILDNVKESNKVEDFYSAKNKSKFVVMRHDVEFSVERAYHLALLEKKENFSSSYYFQLTNNSYNILSSRNMALIKEIKDMGHEVGLHFHLNKLTKIEEIKMQIKKEMEVMQNMLNISMGSFSIHRPTKEVLAADIHLDGYINTYQKEYFDYVEDMSVEKPSIKYISDARHQWNYGLYPDKKTLEQNDKVQILVHPYSWTEKGFTNEENFYSLIKEKQSEIIETFDSECKHFSEVKKNIIERVK